MKKYNLLICIVLILGVSACDDEVPMDREQYIKKVYLVGAADEMVTREIDYAQQEVVTYASVAVGGSVQADRDITVKLTEEADGISSYNSKYLSVNDIQYQKLPSENYRYVSDGAVIKAGDVYGHYSIAIHPEGLHCDSLYAIPLKIASVSDYDVTRNDTVLLVSVKMVNPYSGSYYLSGTKTDIDSEAVTSYAPIRVATAISKNEIRIFHQATEIRDNISSSCFVVKIEDDHTLSLRTWNSFPLITGGGNYNRVNGSLTLWYEYTESSKTYRIDVVMTKSDFVETEEE